MGVLNENTIIGASAAGGYEIDNSLRFNDDDNAYLSRTPSTASNRKTWTWSGWHKRGNVDSDTALFAARTDLDNRIVIYFNSSIGTFNLYTKISAATAALVSTAVYRDASAWYHITVAFDTTQATASNRIKVYVNGEEIALTGAYLAQNADTEINNTVSNLIGISDSMGGNYADGYLAEVNFIDGLALTPDSFGETGDYGEWKPLKYTGAYGTNGFIQEFKDSGDLGKDTSGNGNDFTPTNLAATDQMLDSPTNNFCTLNPLHIVGTVLSEGNVKSTATGVAGGCASQGTIGILNTKTYFEVLVVSNSGGLYIGTTTTAGTTPLVDRGSGICFGASSQIIEYGAFVTYGAAWVVGDIIGVSVDSVNGTLGKALLQTQLSIQSITTLLIFTILVQVLPLQQPTSAKTPHSQATRQHKATQTPTVQVTSTTHLLLASQRYVRRTCLMRLLCLVSILILCFIRVLVLIIMP